ncbi:MAG: 2-oxoacid:acceptor oxidoreductase subunit alpha, partial [Actinomycetota bacterium]
MAKSAEELHRVVIRFAGDSGDGMQLTGDRFTNVSAILGNDLSTLPDFPAEIRAPAGSLFGVSGFQIHFSDEDILTPGDQPNVLVAMNPAALKTNLGDLPQGGMLIMNEDAFTEGNLKKAGYKSNPLEDGSLDGWQVYKVKMTTMTVEATKGIEGITKKDAERAKNMFALGLVSWMYTRPTEPTIVWINKRFAKLPHIAEANVAAFKAGYNFGETAELFAHQFQVKKAKLPPGTYRNITGATSLAWGLIAAAQRAGIPLFYASYPITPASDLLHELSRHKNFGVRTIQAEDEIAAAGMAVGASFAGNIGVTGTSGPGLDLKAETIGLAFQLELPMIIVDVQRAGPSTGMPTKIEQSDLMLAMYGRHGESPLPIVAAYTPAGCFEAAVEAVRIAIKYRTPVILLSDTFLTNSAEPWRLPDVHDLPDIPVEFAKEPNKDGEFWPYLRDENLARPWAIPG